MPKRKPARTRHPPCGQLGIALSALNAPGRELPILFESGRALLSAGSADGDSAQMAIAHRQIFAQDLRHRQSSAARQHKKLVTDLAPVVPEDSVSTQSPICTLCVPYNSTANASHH